MRHPSAFKKYPPLVTLLCAATLALNVNAAPTTTNIALNKSTTVSSAYSSSTQGDKAVDGNTATYWRTKSKSTFVFETINVDLGTATSVSRVVLKWNVYYATNYTIDVSLNNLNWTTVHRVSTENGGTDSIDFAATSARYVRMHSRNWSNNNQRIRLNEFEVYTDDGVVPPPPVAGAWSVVSSPTPTGSASLRGVAAVNTSHVWAVGKGAGTDFLERTLIQQWNGSTWSVVTSPNPSLNGDTLNGVSVVSSTDAWAVGVSNTRSSNFSRAITLHWDGASWLDVAPPDVVDQADQLLGVSAVSSQAVWAVGYSFSPISGGYNPLISFWNGNYWAITLAPTISNSTSAVLNSVTALDANNAWAVGHAQDSGGTTRPLVMRWNGITWSVVTLPNALAGNGATTLNGVSANAANDVWAVGALGSKNLTLHFDGASWREVSSPNDLQKQQNYLTSVAAVSANDVWAVGVSYSSSVNSAGSPVLTEVTTTMHWNGSVWSLVPSPDPTIYHNYLYGVTKVNASDVWAVGNTADFYNKAATMTQHYTSP